nr:hypothetical protein GCM10020093_083710 [Planobispora longispora]
MPYLVVMVVIPIGPGLVGVDLDAGLFFVLAVMGIGVLGSIMAGWSSGNKYSLMGGMRSAAQLMSYELPLVLAASSVAMAAGTLSLPGIVEAWQWWWLPWQAVGGVVFFMAGLAELRRPPFDMPIAESEIIMGPMTEYTGIRFALFMLAEYAGIIVLSALTSVLFLGGWHGPLLPGPVWMLIKVFALVFVVIWVRVSYPGSARTSCRSSPGPGWSRWPWPSSRSRGSSRSSPSDGPSQWTIRSMMSAAVGRLAGSFSRQTAASGRSDGGSGDRSGCWLSTRLRMAGMVSEPKATRPEAAKIMVDAQLNTSDSGPTCPRRAARGTCRRACPSRWRSR